MIIICKINRYISGRGDYLKPLSTGADCRYWRSGMVRNTVVELTEPLNELDVLVSLGLWAYVDKNQKRLFLLLQ